MFLCVSARFASFCERLERFEPQKSSPTKYPPSKNTNEATSSIVQFIGSIGHSFFVFFVPRCFVFQPPDPTPPPPSVPPRPEKPHFFSPSAKISPYFFSPSAKFPLFVFCISTTFVFQPFSLLYFNHLTPPIHSPPLGTGGPLKIPNHLGTGFGAFGCPMVHRQKIFEDFCPQAKRFGVHKQKEFKTQGL